MEEKAVSIEESQCPLEGKTKKTTPQASALLGYATPRLPPLTVMMPTSFMASCIFGNFIQQAIMPMLSKQFKNILPKTNEAHSFSIRIFYTIFVIFVLSLCQNQTRAKAWQRSNFVIAFTEIHR